MVHGVTIEEVQKALQRNDWNPLRAEQQLKVRMFFLGFLNILQIHIAFTHPLLCSIQAEQLYHMNQCSREDCHKILARYNWDLQMASRFVIRMATERRSDRP